MFSLFWPSDSSSSPGTAWSWGHTMLMPHRISFCDNTDQMLPNKYKFNPRKDISSCIICTLMCCSPNCTIFNYFLGVLLFQCLPVWIEYTFSRISPSIPSWWNLPIEVRTEFCTETSFMFSKFIFFKRFVKWVMGKKNLKSAYNQFDSLWLYKVIIWLSFIAKNHLILHFPKGKLQQTWEQTQSHPTHSQHPQTAEPSSTNTKNAKRGSRAWILSKYKWK